MSIRLGRRGRGSWRVVAVVVIVGLVLAIPTAQFAGRVGQDVAGDGGYYVGAAAGGVAVFVLAALAARLVTALTGTSRTAPPTDPVPPVDPHPPSA